MSKSYSRTSLAPAALWLLALAGLIGLLAAPVAAKTKPEAAATAADEESNDPCLLDGLCRAHYLRARTLSKDGNFEGALSAYEAAYRRRPSPWLLISIGRTLHKLGRPAEAIQQYERYRQEDKSPNPTRLERVAEYTKQAQADLAAAPKPTPPAPVSPVAPVEPAVGTPTPGQPVAVSDGGKGTAGPGEPASPAGKPATAANPPPESKAESPGVRVTATAEPASSPAPPAPSRLRWSGLWIGLGVTGGLLLVGGALGIAAQVSSAQLRGTTYVGNSPSGDIVGLQERTRGLAISADTFFAATAVSLGVTLALTLARKPVAERPPARPLPGLEDLGPPPTTASKSAASVEPKSPPLPTPNSEASPPPASTPATAAPTAVPGTAPTPVPAAAPAAAPLVPPASAPTGESVAPPAATGPGAPTAAAPSSGSSAPSPAPPAPAPERPVSPAAASPATSPSPPSAPGTR